MKGFTFVEVIVVVGIFLIAFALVIMALNPREQLLKSQNIKRKQDISTLLQAIRHYVQDNKGQYPPGISQAEMEISKNGVDLCALLVPSYVAALPVDPNLGNTRITRDRCDTNYATGYTVAVDAFGQRITVKAPQTALGEEITTTQ
jgi:prepilin-type N-terminal cleavage/methylation domain-containing protein